jgi:hypothetical protein
MAANNKEQHHTLLTVIIVAVVLLTVGQLILYRNIQSVKSMISETAMELKEGKGVKDPTISPSQTEGEYMMDDSTLR